MSGSDNRKRSRKSEPRNVRFNLKNGVKSNEEQGTGATSSLENVVDTRGVRKTNPYYSWKDRYGEQVPNNSQESLLMADDDDKFDKFDSRLYLGDTKATAIKRMQRDIPISPNPSDTQDKLKRKYMLQNPTTFERNANFFAPNSLNNPAVVQESIKKHADMMDTRHRLKKGFRFMHALFFISGIGLLAAGFCVDKVMSQMLATLGINLADQAKKLYIGSGAAIIVTAILGHIVVIVHRFKILTWLFYLLILCLGACSVGSAGFTCLKTYKNHTVPRTKLFDLMTAYNGKTGAATDKWDAVHQGYKCCGIDNFTDWDSSPYGRTSLRTPMSCCRNHSIVKDEFCGQNLLPETDIAVADKIIFADGCIKLMMNKLDVWYLITGLYAAIVTIIISFHFIFCFFLIASHRL